MRRAAKSSVGHEGHVLPEPSANEGTARREHLAHARATNRSLVPDKQCGVGRVSLSTKRTTREVNTNTHIQTTRDYSSPCSIMCGGNQQQQQQQQQQTSSTPQNVPNHKNISLDNLSRLNGLECCILRVKHTSRAGKHRKGFSTDGVAGTSWYSRSKQ